MSEWELIVPKVNESAEFLEIANDFGDPREIFREAIHNAFDWEATEFEITITVEEINGKDKLVIVLSDNGTGMSKETIINNFWNLVKSKSKNNKNSIGEKGMEQKYIYGQMLLYKLVMGIIHMNQYAKEPSRRLTQAKYMNRRLEKVKYHIQKAPPFALKDIIMTNGQCVNRIY